MTINSLGQTNITATYGSYQATYTVYGILSDGLFTLQNHGSYLYATIEGNALLQVTDSVREIDEKTQSRNQIWHIQYAGLGRYLIRCRTNPVMAMAPVPGNTSKAGTINIGSSLPPSDSSAYWTIIGTNGYYSGQHFYIIFRSNQY